MILMEEKKLKVFKKLFKISEHKYGVEIVAKDGEILNLLDLIKKTLPVEYDIKERTIYIILKY